MAATSGFGQVHATQEQLAAMAQRCQDTGQGLATGMAQLVDRIQALSGGGMAGAANNALQDVSVQLNEGMRKIVTALDELSGKIGNASTQFGATDEEAAQDIRTAGTADASVLNILRG